MRITNNYNLPEQIVNAVTFGNRKPSDNTISVTDLVGPTMIRHLKLQHWDELEEDASDRLWALLGQAAHYVLERHALPESFSEERLHYKLFDTIITGQSDNYNAETKTVEDWKVTSVWSFLDGVKSEWEAQLNCYAWLWRQNGFEVECLKIYAVLRDWQKGRSHVADYPDIPFKTVVVGLWPADRISDYIHRRLAAHYEDILPCTERERWSKEDVYAVMKEGQKKAVKLFDEFKEAMAFTATNDKYTVVKRPGEFTRCKSYCPVRSVCEFNPYREQLTQYVPAPAEESVKNILGG